MELIILGHIIGDFYVQTDKIAEKKKKSIKCMLLHCLMYSIIVGISFFILNKNMMETLGISCIILLTHLIVDLVKGKCDRKTDRCGYMIFIADQAVHILILFSIFYMVKNNFSYLLDGKSIINGLDMRTCIKIVSVILICWKPAAIFVSLVFEVIPKTVEQADETKKNELSIGKEHVRTGSWIGILEREIILMLGLMGQYSAIGFVLTAKSLARFKQLENKSFAEKYLVGTLLSAFIAILCIVICKIDILI